MNDFCLHFHLMCFTCSSSGHWIKRERERWRDNVAHKTIETSIACQIVFLGLARKRGAENINIAGRSMIAHVTPVGCMKSGRNANLFHHEIVLMCLTRRAKEQ